ncbi:glutathione S-transferase C-terminal-like protein [Suillus paluster]|uniref:glutathione S-transferase C-terminal-like protein n=1 Tax=Suillus paluster TaxID=48578 RepID=UPI001B86F4EE|nr:glutathione S-transferase C-terminal-like protein [Suillus paluster]KAG1725781.1 glutathione S-transferase C-terminal-like protein [Suillus paluster]
MPVVSSRRRLRVGNGFESHGARRPLYQSQLLPLALSGVFLINVKIDIYRAAAIAGLEVKPFKFGVTNKSLEFLDKFPLAKIPAFEGKSGFTLLEGASIGRYVASLAPESGLFGNSVKDTALVDQWIHFAEHEINAYTDIIWQLVERFFPEKAYSEGIHKSIFERQERSPKFLEQHINRRNFLVTDEITLEDIILAAVIQRAARVTLGAAERALYPNIFSRYAKVAADLRIKDIFGTVDFVEVPLAPKKVE